MEAKEKAIELTDKYLDDKCYNGRYGGDEYDYKYCALIAVNEIINANPHSNPLNTDVYSTMAYWLEVKNEIEKL